MPNKNHMFAGFAVLALLAVAALPQGAAVVGPIDNRDAALRGADRLLALQFADGSFPWLVGDSGSFQNVQGVTALGLLDAYLLSLDSAYLDAAGKTRDWLDTYRSSAVPPKLLSASNVYFLARYALLSQQLGDLDLARAALADRVNFYGSPESTILSVIQARVNQGHKNLGLWDSSLTIRSAQDVGDVDTADRMADALATQTIVNPFDATANWYELGLAGLVLGLSEADAVAHHDLIAQAVAALEAAQQANGAWGTTFGGVLYPDDTQGTAYVSLALLAAADPVPALKGADFIRSTQHADGGFAAYLPDDGTEYAEGDSEAVQALVAAVLLAPNGVVAYADAAVGALPR